MLLMSNCFKIFFYLNTTLKLRRGHRYGMCGSNGCGKSTLLKAINRKQIDTAALFAGRGGSDDILVAPGDTVYVSKAPVYYIYGEAQKPGYYRVERNMTVMQAIAAGGGITPRGSQRRLSLTRTSPTGQVVEISPKLTDTIQAGDVLVVKESIF